MNVDSINYQRLEEISQLHKTWFVTPTVSRAIDDAGLEEVVLYAYGTIAAGAEAEDSRKDREVRPHEGRLDCETSQHFWRGVHDTAGSYGLFNNRRTRKKTGRTEYPYPWFEVRGSRLLIARMGFWLSAFGPFWSAAEEALWDAQADSEKGGVVRLTGSPAQAAVMSLCMGASIGSRLERAHEIADWRPLRGWCAAQRGRIPPRTNVACLSDIPADVFDR